MREYFNPDWTEYVFGALVATACQALLLVSATFAASVWVKPAALRGALWTACVVALAVMPLLSLALPHLYLGYIHPNEPLHFPSLIERPVPGVSRSSTLWTFYEGEWGDGACRAIVFLWLAGVAVTITRMLYGSISMAWLLRRAESCRDPRVFQILESIPDAPRNISFLVMDRLVGALCWQIHHPKIILPRDTHRLSNRELEMILLHELAHVRRGDPGTLFLQRLVEIAYWFHPAVWSATLQASKYREFACDDLVIRRGYEPQEYAHCLCRLAISHYAPAFAVPTGLGILWNQHQVLQRIKRQLHNSPTAAEAQWGRRVIAVAAIIVAISVGIVRLAWDAFNVRASHQWTPWPPQTAALLDAIGFRVRDFPLDAHRYDPRETAKLAAADRH